METVGTAESEARRRGQQPNDSGVRMDGEWQTNLSVGSSRVKAGGAGVRGSGEETKGSGEMTQSGGGGVLWKDEGQGGGSGDVSESLPLDVVPAVGMALKEDGERAALASKESGEWAGEVLG